MLRSLAQSGLSTTKLSESKFGLIALTKIDVICRLARSPFLVSKSSCNLTPQPLNPQVPKTVTLSASVHQSIPRVLLCNFCVPNLSQLLPNTIMSPTLNPQAPTPALLTHQSCNSDIPLESTQPKLAAPMGA